MPAPRNATERRALIEKFDRGPMAEAFKILPPALNSPRARALMLKIGLQEGRLYHRDQITAGTQFLGPALSVWQFERGGVRGVLMHDATKAMARKLAAARGVPATIDGVWEAMLTDDILGAGMTRLNLYWHRRPLPPIHDCWESWQYYLECWRPGKPHPETWPDFHEEVVAYLTAQG